MDEKPTEQSSAALDAFFEDWIARMERLSRERRAPEPPRDSRPELRLVPNCGRLVQTHNRDYGLSDMAFYARNIRAFRTGEIDHAPNRPKLTLVRSRDTIETSRTTT